MRKTLFVLWVITAFLFSFVFSESLLHIGIPSLRVVTTLDGIITSLDGTVIVEKQELQPEEKREYRVVITTDENNNIFWKSRKNKLLTVSKSGIYTIFTALSGAGYIKIDLGNKLYIEHLHFGLGTFTYYGTLGVQ